MKILITGGHLTPALATIDYIQKHHPTDTVVFVGVDITQKKSQQQSKERKEVEKRGITFINFSAVKLSELLSLTGIFIFFSFVSSCFKASQIIGKQKPDVILSFGGYVAIPFAIAGTLQKKPIVTHEQTRVAGFANKFIAKFAKKIAVSYKETIHLFPKDKTVLTGNPIRQSLFDAAPQPSWIPFSPKTRKPILYITGGNQGSQVMNQVVGKIIPQLTTNWNVIHQSGSPTVHSNYKQTLEKIKQNLSPRKQTSYVVREWLEESELAWVYQHATAVVSRSGANTSQELISFAIPSVLIPLPFSYQNEQLTNAQSLAKIGIAKILKQQKLSPKSLEKTIHKIYQSRHAIKKKAIIASEKVNHKAAANLYTIVTSCV